MRAVLLVAMLMLAGCSHVSYYLQAIHGQAEISQRAMPIATLLGESGAEGGLAARLALVQQARDFASRELKLPDNGSFRRYADLGRRYVVWNVFAAPEFAVTPKTWCFPIAGCVAYRGYFAEAAARHAAAELAAQGFDVHVAGVPVYSTLGWFDDPVLNTFIHYPEADLVGLLFHELAHQLLYVPGDSAFNESFATAVEEEGVRRWFEQRGQAAGFAAFQQAQMRKHEFVALLTATRDRLATLYEAGGEPDALRARKAQVLAQAHETYAALKRAWGGYAGYDRWFADGALNNAKLASVTLYADHLPAFRILLAQAQGDLPTLYAQARALAELPKPERHAALARAGQSRLAAEAAAP